MIGGGDDDTLVGGAGADQLKGGAGSDTSVYRSVSDSGPALSMRDLITDFGSGDKIDVSAIGVDDLSITFDGPNNRTIIQLFVGNDATADAVIMLSGDHSALTPADFVL